MNIYKTTPRPNTTQKQPRKSKEECPLSDPSIGIISENDHRVGLCLCRYCECGSHQCSRFSDNICPRSSFSTKYQHDYQKNAFDVPLRIESRLYKPNTAKMDLTTTNQIEYQARAPTPEVTKPFSISPNKQDISKITAYASDYPDWGPVKVNHEKRWHPPVRSVEIPFQGKSSYKGHFTDFQQAQVDMYKSDITQFKAFGSKFSLAPKEKFNTTTTYSEKMKDFSGNDLNSKVVTRAAPLTPTPAMTNHFKTTFQDCFKHAPPASKDPRQIRFNLQSQKTKRNKSVQLN
jgi:hypothetical protein